MVLKVDIQADITKDAVQETNLPKVDNIELKDAAFKIDFSEKKWTDVESTSEYIDMDLKAQGAVQDAYFTQNVAPKVNTDIVSVEETKKFFKEQADQTITNTKLNDAVLKDLTDDEREYAKNAKSWIVGAVGVKDMKEWDKKGSIELAEAAERFDYIKTIPWLNVASDIRDINLMRMTRQYAEGTLNQKEKEEVADFLYNFAEMEHRGYSTGAAIFDGAIQAPGFLVEFATGLGAASVAKKGAVKVAKKAVAKGFKKTMMNMAQKGTLKGIGELAKRGTKKLAVVSGVTANRAVNKFSSDAISRDIMMTDKGQFFIKDKEDPVKAWSKAIGSHLISTEVEFVGGQVLRKMASPLTKATPKMLSEAGTKFMQLFNKATAGQASKLFKAKDKIGWNGLLEEYGEEQLDAILQHVAGFDGEEERSLTKIGDILFPDQNQFVIEAAVIGLTGMAGTGVNSLRKKLVSKGYQTKDINKILEINSASETDTMNENFTAEEVKAQQKEIKKTDTALKAKLDTIGGFSRKDTKGTVSDVKVETSPESALKAVYEGVSSGKAVQAIHNGEIYSSKDLDEIIKIANPSQSRVGKEALSAIKEFGGIQEDADGELKNIGYKTVSKGITAHEMAVKLNEEGFIEDSNVETMYEMMDYSLKGNKNYSSKFATEVQDNQDRVIQAENAQRLLNDIGLTDVEAYKSTVSTLSFKKSDMIERQAVLLREINNANIPAENKTKLLSSVKNIKTQLSFVQTMNSLKNKIKEQSDIAARTVEKVKFNNLITTSTVGMDVNAAKYYKELKRINNLTQKEASAELSSIEEDGRVAIEGGIQDRLLYVKTVGVNNVTPQYLQILNKDITELRKVGKENFEDRKEERLSGISGLSSQMTNALDNKVKPRAFARYQAAAGTRPLIESTLFGKKLADEMDMHKEVNTMAKNIYTKREGLTTAIQETYGLKKRSNVGLFVKNMSVADKNITIGEGKTKHELSKMDLVSIFAELQNEQRKEAYYKHYGKKSIDKAVSNLSAEDKVFAFKLIDAYRPYFDKVNKTLIDIKGVELGYKENFTPWKSDTTKKFDTTAYVGESKNPSLIKSTIEGARPIPSNAYKNAIEYINNAEYLINIAPKHNIIVNAVQDNKQVIINNYNKKFYTDYINKLELNGLATIKNSNSRDIDLFNKTLGLWAKTRVALKTIVSAKQVVSLFNYAEHVPKSYFVKNLPSSVFNYKTNKEETMDVTRLQARAATGADDASRLVLDQILAGSNVRKTLFEKAGINQESVDKALTANTRLFDIIPQVIGGSIVYKYKTEVEGMSHQEAMDFVSKISDRTQQTQHNIYRTDLQNSAFGLNKIFTMFKSAPIASMDRLAQLHIEYRRGEVSADQFATASALYVGAIAVSLTSLDYMWGMMFGDEDKRDDMEELDLQKEFIKSALGIISTVTPIASTVISAGASIALDDDAYDANVPVLQDFIRSAKKLTKKNPEYLPLVETTVETLIGVPLGTIIDDAVYIDRQLQ